MAQRSTPGGGGRCALTLGNSPHPPGHCQSLSAGRRTGRRARDTNGWGYSLCRQTIRQAVGGTADSEDHWRRPRPGDSPGAPPHSYASPSYARLALQHHGRRGSCCTRPRGSGCSCWQCLSSGFTVRLTPGLAAWCAITGVNVKRPGNLLTAVWQLIALHLRVYDLHRKYWHLDALVHYCLPRGFSLLCRPDFYLNQCYVNELGCLEISYIPWTL